MKNIVFILSLFMLFFCYSQKNQSVSIDGFSKKKEIFLSSDSSIYSIIEKIKVANTFSFYNRCFDDSLKTYIQKEIDVFENNDWKIIKTKYDFKMTRGGGYYSKVLDIHYGGVVSNKTDYYSIDEYKECFKRSKEKYYNDLD